MTAIRVLTRRALAAIKTSNALFHILLTMGVPNLAALVQRVQAILPQGQRGGEERIVMPPVTDRGPLSNQSQCRTNESPGPLALQKRKLENFELRLRGETRAFWPANEN